MCLLKCLQWREATFWGVGEGVYFGSFFKQCHSVYVTFLLEILQWFPFAYRKSLKVLAGLVLNILKLLFVCLFFKFGGERESTSRGGGGREANSLLIKEPT